MSECDQSINPVIWKDDTLQLLDQRLLPAQEVWLRLETVDAAADAISDMVVRGAPAIGVTAAYAVVLAARERYAHDQDDWKTAITADLERLLLARPTAVNLRWAVEKMAPLIAAVQGEPVAELLAAARKIHREDITANQRMGELGAAYIGADDGVLTHCNAGALATAGYGTALGVIRSAWRGSEALTVFADETRPWLQGARLTAWELLRDGIPVQLLADGAAAYLMQLGKVQWVVVGADRVASNGDVANKIGTYGLAVSARHHGVKFMVVAPTTTIDMQAASGADIPIEQRDPNELLHAGGQRVAADGAAAWNPVFDVTPAALVDVLVTEKGALDAPNAESIRALMASSPG
jgi:methylthioribose-1-phosphate isomerase